MADRLQEQAEDYSPITSATDPWDELRVGEYALAIGALREIHDPNGPLKPGPTIETPAITIGFSDWSDLLIEVPDGIPAEVHQLRKGFRTLNFKLRRTEDGFEGVAVWEPGGMPIPLAQQRTTVS